jgi:hypothetical protein
MQIEKLFGKMMRNEASSAAQRRAAGVARTHMKKKENSFAFEMDHFT